MKAVSIVLHSLAAGVALLVSVTATQAADDFVQACMLGASGSDMSKTCACMESKIPADGRAEAG